MLIIFIPEKQQKLVNSATQAKDEEFKFNSKSDEEFKI
jgi:hypothetical protein